MPCEPPTHIYKIVPWSTDDFNSDNAAVLIKIDSDGVVEFYRNDRDDGIRSAGYRPFVSVTAGEMISVEANPEPEGTN